MIFIFTVIIHLHKPFEDDKPKDAENSPFDASSVLVVKASLNDRH
jgi:hypothetical protein